MESSKIFGDDDGAEEYQSSESGWTMYIGSPIDDDDDDGHGMTKKNVYDDDEYECDGSDDSMASDASSGPSHLHQYQQQPWEGGHGHDHGMALKYHKDDKVKKQVKKKKKKKKKSGFESRNEPKEECLVDEKKGIVTVQSGNMARYIGGG